MIVFYTVRYFHDNDSWLQRLPAHLYRPAPESSTDIFNESPTKMRWYLGVAPNRSPFWKEFRYPMSKTLQAPAHQVTPCNFSGQFIIHPYCNLN